MPFNNMVSPHDPARPQDKPGTHDSLSGVLGAGEEADLPEGEQGRRETRRSSAIMGAIVVATLIAMCVIGLLIR